MSDARRRRQAHRAPTEEDIQKMIKEIAQHYGGVLDEYSMEVDTPDSVSECTRGGHPDNALARWIDDHFLSEEAYMFIEKLMASQIQKAVERYRAATEHGFDKLTIDELYEYCKYARDRDDDKWHNRSYTHEELIQLAIDTHGKHVEPFPRVDSK